MEPPYKEKPQHRTGGNVLELECCQDKANGAEKNTAAQVVGTGESQTER